MVGLMHASADRFARLNGQMVDRVKQGDHRRMPSYAEIAGKHRILTCNDEVRLLGTGSGLSRDP